ncbi:MAG: hypothetical protein ACP5HY_10580, partial [Caldivirga sp.]
TVNGVKPLMDLLVFVESGFKASLGIQEEASKLYDVAIQLGVHEDLGISESGLLKYKAMQARVNQLTVSELKDYLTLDVIVTHALASKWMPTLQALGALTGSNPMVINQVAESASPGHLAEALIHKWLEFNGIILQDRVRQFNYEAGDKTKARSAGLFRNVAEYDFSAMYPSLYTQDNVDPTMIKECGNGFPVSLIKEDGGRLVRRVCFEPGGLVHGVLASLYRARRATKALKATYGDAPDHAVKILVNSAYGVFGKAGLGMVNEWIAGYIAQKTQVIFDDLWRRYEPVYGDTDSMYVLLNGRDPSSLLEGINNELHAEYGSLMEMKLEGVWDILYIPSSLTGGVAEKTYIKLKGSKLVIKGGALKPRDLPKGLRYGAYRDWVKAILLGGVRLSDLSRGFVTGAGLGDLFIEYSITFRDLLYTHEGKPIRVIDKSRFPALAYLTLIHNGVTVSLRDGSINGEPIRLSDFIDVLYLPIDTRGDSKAFILLINDEPTMVKVNLTLDSRSGRIRGRLMGRSIVDRGLIEDVTLRVIRESGLFSHLTSLGSLGLNSN